MKPLINCTPSREIEIVFGRSTGLLGQFSRLAKKLKRRMHATCKLSTTAAKTPQHKTSQQYHLRPYVIPFRAPKSLPILTSSKSILQKGFLLQRKALSERLLFPFVGVVNYYRIASLAVSICKVHLRLIICDPRARHRHGHWLCAGCR